MFQGELLDAWAKSDRLRRLRGNGQVHDSNWKNYMASILTTGGEGSGRSGGGDEPTGDPGMHQEVEMYLLGQMAGTDPRRRWRR